MTNKDAQIASLENNLQMLINKLENIGKECCKNKPSMEDIWSMTFVSTRARNLARGIYDEN